MTDRRAAADCCGPVSHINRFHCPNGRSPAPWKASFAAINDRAEERSSTMSADRKPSQDEIERARHLEISELMKQQTRVLTALLEQIPTS